MNKKISLSAAISFMAIVAAITFSVTMIFSLNIFNLKINNIKEKTNLSTKINELDNIIRNNYIGQLDEQYLLDSMAKGMVSGTGDAYSSYMTAEELQNFNKTLSGIVAGIGISTQKDESGYIKITKVYSGTPAGESGLQVDDLITSVDKEEVKTIGYDAALAKIKGEAGTKVILTIKRNGEDQTLELVRNDNKLPTVEYKVIDSKAYIKISNFTDTTVEEFTTATNKAMEENLKDLIIDLRDTSSINLTVASDIASALLPSGNIIVAKYADGKTKAITKSDSKKLDFNIAVITNSSTSSAGELLASCIKSYKAGKIIGTKTMGKAVIQDIFTLKDGSGVMLTTAYFVSPTTGEDINGIGITPDFEVTLTTEQEKNLYKLDEKTDPQLKKALEVVGTQK